MHDLSDALNSLPAKAPQDQQSVQQTNAESNTPVVIPQNWKDLFTSEPKFWDGIVQGINFRFRDFDKLLLQLHYQRSKPLDDTRRKLILKFLSIGYLFSKDVRYFNEFLWFSNDSKHPLYKVSLAQFKQNLFDGKHHLFPLADRNKVQSRIDQIQTKSNVENSGEKKPKIGLLGNPPSFKKIRTRLKKHNCSAKVYDLPYSPSRFGKAIKDRQLILNLLYRIQGCHFDYERVDFWNDDARLRKYFQSESLDLGIHHLGFILRKDLFEPFRLGVLNDHLGILPFIRGRSSIEYSLLFDFPLGATVHFVDESVDTGDILRFFSYERGSASTIQEVKQMILRQHDDRLLETVQKVITHGVQRVQNLQEAGLQYFSMHPLLIDYINKTVLSSKESE
jgi:hypothetical protein